MGLFWPSSSWVGLILWRKPEDPPTQFKKKPVESYSFKSKSISYPLFSFSFSFCLLLSTRQGKGEQSTGARDQTLDLRLIAWNSDCLPCLLPLSADLLAQRLGGLLLYDLYSTWPSPKLQVSFRWNWYIPLGVNISWRYHFHLWDRGKWKRYSTSVLISFVITQWLGPCKSPTEELPSLGNLGEHCLYHTWPIPKLLSTGQRYTAKDLEESPSNQEANHRATRVDIRGQSQRDTCQHQKPITTRHVSMTKQS